MKNIESQQTSHQNNYLKSTSPFLTRRKPLYPGGPRVSLCGFGGYRIGGYLGEEKAVEGEDALREALQRGVNLIDTSSNYRFGLSEQLIGKILSENLEWRNSTTIVTKGGYIQGPDLERVAMQEHDGMTYPHVLKFSSQLWYCMHPEFLETQLEQSLERLKLDKIDVYLLHNPEYLLKKLEYDGFERDEAREIFYERIKLCFEAFEKWCKHGKIASYGISSNNLGLPDDEIHTVSLNRLIEIAQMVKPTSHHFKVVQCPINWLEPLPALYSSSGKVHDTFLSIASSNGIGVLVNRPFNAFMRDSLFRLTQPKLTQEEIQSFSQIEHDNFQNWQTMSEMFYAGAKMLLEDCAGFEHATLSQLVIATLSSLPGVSSVLCGMRQKNYVDDIEEALRLPSLTLRSREFLLSFFRSIEFETTH